MNDDINLGGPSLVALLDRIGLPQAARDRVAEIDRELASRLKNNDPDADGCAALVIEATTLVLDCDPSRFDWTGATETAGVTIIVTQ